MIAPAVRFPAEWEPQSAVLLAWPHAGTDWAPRLPAVEAAYVELVAAIARFEHVLVCVPDELVRASAAMRLAHTGIPGKHLHFIEVEYDDTWLRDSGPITLVGTDRFHLLDFHFTAWGGKYAASRDDRLIAQLFAHGLFPQARRERIDFALEGGAIETDGDGTLLTTWQCLHARHPDLDRSELSARLAQVLHQRRVLWLDHGALAGDDTDAHIDTLARFASPEAIVYQACDDATDPHHAPLTAMARELASLHTLDGKPYLLFALPWPRPIVDDGRRLAASYANFLIVNGAVLMPAYDDPADAIAAQVLAQAFPRRQIVPVPCRDLIWQNGSLHCLTMQLPKGLLAA